MGVLFLSFVFFRLCYSELFCGSEAQLVAPVFLNPVGALESTTGGEGSAIFNLSRSIGSSSSSSSSSSASTRWIWARSRTRRRSRFCQWKVNSITWELNDISDEFSWNKWKVPIQSDFSGVFTFVPQQPFCEIQALFVATNSQPPSHLELTCDLSGSYQSILPSTVAVPVKKPNNKEYSETNVAFFASEAPFLYAITVDAVSGTMDTSTCNPDLYFSHDVGGLAVDSEGGVFIADTGASKLQYVSPGCTSMQTVIPAGHFISSPTDVEILDSLGLLAVSSWDKPGIFLLQLDQNRQMLSFTDSGATTRIVTGFTECALEHENSKGLLFSEDGLALIFYDVVKKERTVIFDSSWGSVTDITDIEFRDCGIFFTSSGNRNVWKCGGFVGPDFLPSCHPDVSTCVSLCAEEHQGHCVWEVENPTGLVVDCQCNVFWSDWNGNFDFFRDSISPIMTISDRYGTPHIYEDLDLYERGSCKDTHPPLMLVCVYSTNSNFNIAVEGDYIYATVHASEPVKTPIINCNISGHPIRLQTYSDENSRNIDYWGEYQVIASSPRGNVSCEFTAVDPAGNVGTNWSFRYHDCYCVVE